MGNQCFRRKGGSYRSHVKSPNGQMMPGSQQKGHYCKSDSNDRHSLSSPHTNKAFPIQVSGTVTNNKKKTITTLKNCQQQEVFVNQQHQHKGDVYVVPSTRDSDVNWRFYQNKLKSNFGMYIEDILKWTGCYVKLEHTHDFIQWLFPIPDSSGVNYFAKALSLEEAKWIRDDQCCSNRVLTAYKMMLDFYGMQLKSINTGEIDRSDNYMERYMHLNRSPHNYRRITRILTSLGYLGYERFQRPWVDFLISEVVVNKELSDVDMISLNFWVNAVHDDGEREYLFKKLSNLTQSKEFHKYEAYDYNH